MYNLHNISFVIWCSLLPFYLHFYACDVGFPFYSRLVFRFCYYLNIFRETLYHFGAYSIVDLRQISALSIPKHPKTRQLFFVHTVLKAGFCSQLVSPNWFDFIFCFISIVKTRNPINFYYVCKSMYEISQKMINEKRDKNPMPCNLLQFEIAYDFVYESDIINGCLQHSFLSLSYTLWHFLSILNRVVLDRNLLRNGIN